MCVFSHHHTHSNVDSMYNTIGELKHIVAVDIYQGKVIGSSLLPNQYHSLVPCDHLLVMFQFCKYLGDFVLLWIDRAPSCYVSVIIFTHNFDSRLVQMAHSLLLK